MEGFTDEEFELMRLQGGFNPEVPLEKISYTGFDELKLSSMVSVDGSLFINSYVTEDQIDTCEIEDLNL